MLVSGIHCCPRCDGAVDRKHHTMVKVADRVDRFLYCAFCGLGWETSTYDDGDIFVLDHVEKTEPVDFGNFLQRLEAALAA